MVPDENISLSAGMGQKGEKKNILRMRWETLSIKSYPRIISAFEHYTPLIPSDLVTRVPVAPANRSLLMQSLFVASSAASVADLIAFNFVSPASSR